MNVIWRVSAYLFRYRVLFVLTLVLAVGMTLLAIAVPRVIQWIFNDMIAAGDYRDLWLGVALMVALYAGRELCNCFRIRINNTVEQKVLLDLRGDLHDKLLHLPVGFYDRRKSGEIASRVIEDVQAVERALLDGTEQGLTAVLMIVGIITMLFMMEPMLAWLVIAPMPVLLVLGWLHARATRRYWKTVREAAGELNSLLVEDIQGNRLIHSFALKDRERRRFREQAERLRDRTLKAMFRWSLHSPASNFISSLGTVAVVGMGGYLMISADHFKLGDVVAFFFYAAMLYEPIGRINNLNHMLAAAAASGRRVFEILDHPLDVQSPPDPKPFPSDPLLEARFENISFAYPDRDEVIEELDLTLPAGRMTALVGHTGAGKSTIANLLLRYYDVTQGAVRINGIDVREMDLTDLRRQIGYVAQDPFLFDGTVEENLRLARPDASLDEIEGALRGACAWEFVAQLPGGIAASIGEKGIRLSMGEKQRLTIARVLLKNPRMVILDEATASVDTATERGIQEALDNLMRDRTLLVIAHRLSTVRKADQIVVLDHGRIVERGDHTQLCESGGPYAALWRYQHDFIPERVN